MPAFCMQVTYAANDDVLVTAGYDQCVKVWDCKSRSIDPIQVMKVFQVRQLAFKRQGTGDQQFSAGLRHTAPNFRSTTRISWVVSCCTSLLW